MNLQYVCKFNSVIPGIMPSVSIPSIIKLERRIKVKCQTCKPHEIHGLPKNVSKQTLPETQKEINICNIIEGNKFYWAANGYGLWKGIFNSNSILRYSTQQW